MVRPDEVDDLMSYQSTIKLTVVRETRATEEAK